jgi:hypothetical protein
MSVEEKLEDEETTTITTKGAHLAKKTALPVRRPVDSNLGLYLPNQQILFLRYRMLTLLPKLRRTKQAGHT